MEGGVTPDHSPVQRLGAERYLRRTLIWFALTVIVVRSALAATGYPKLGGGELHIAHVLWGGLFLFGAALSPLLFANRWALETSAVLAGIRGRPVHRRGGQVHHADQRLLLPAGGADHLRGLPAHPAPVSARAERAGTHRSP